MTSDETGGAGKGDEDPRKHGKAQQAGDGQPSTPEQAAEFVFDIVIGVLKVTRPHSKPLAEVIYYLEMAATSADGIVRGTPDSATQIGQPTDREEDRRDGEPL